PLTSCIPPSYRRACSFLAIYLPRLASRHCIPPCSCPRESSSRSRRDMAGRDGDVAVMAVAEDEARRRRRRQAERVALPAGMVLVQVLTVVTMLLSKVALNSGMHPLVLLVYRNLVGAAFVAPLAVVFERYARNA
uniref:WAT1-related protein n=1 Tax=Aegilops tauschii subsp. strangulata TaxID=200361 RepID=A0A452XF01_AEGTS